MAQKHGYDADRWEKAKAEVKALLAQRARVKGVMAYSDLVNKVEAIRFDPNSYALSAMLGEISAEEDAASRGMLTVLVVHKEGDMQPGPGFFELAKQLRRDTSDILGCWIKELNKVHGAWSQQKKASERARDAEQ